MLYNASISVTMNGNVKVKGHDWASRQHAQKFGREWGEDLSEKYSSATFSYGVKVYVDAGDPEAVKSQVADALAASGKTTL